MGKFRIRLKLQGLELEVNGEREDLSAVTAAVQRELAGLVPPAEAFTDGRKQLGETAEVIEAEVEKTKSRGRRRSSASTDGAGAQPFDFRHDPEQYGNPLQTWSVTEKCVWLLFVVKSITGTKELSGPQLAATFNEHFRAAGRIHPPHVTRDLNKAKVQNPAPLGEHKGLWYLTDEGDRQAQQLIQSALNLTAP